MNAIAVSTTYTAYRSFKGARSIIHKLVLQLKKERFVLELRGLDNQIKNDRQGWFEYLEESRLW